MLYRKLRLPLPPYEGEKIHERLFSPFEGQGEVVFLSHFNFNFGIISS